jgi:[CysO sulfur-carrier protein]-S-L-cysteine hydrolase
MKLLIPAGIKTQLVDALHHAGKREIGGIVMGEHVGPDTFRVKELTIQRKGGSFATFTRFITAFLAPLRAFFDKTKHNYKKFNYVGEWHSHHSFVLTPSGPDDASMREIVSDPLIGARFVVLMLVKLDQKRNLQGAITVYLPQGQKYAGDLFFEKRF